MNDFKLGFMQQSSIRKVLEACVLIFVTAGFSILVTSSGTGLLELNIFLSFLIILIFIGATFIPFVKKLTPFRNILAILSGLGFGLWLFCFLRFMGLTAWPYGDVISLGQYMWLFYYHFVLAVTVLAPILIVTQYFQIKPEISVGNWRIGKRPTWNKTFLLLIIIGIWIWPIYLILKMKPAGTGPFYGFLIIALIKALINGTLEEYCYRGLIQKSAVLHFGVTGGIILQSFLYTAFHLGLGELFVSKALFLCSIFSMGILFGIMTHLTSGIGWACLAHIAVDLVVEWRNIS